MTTSTAIPAETRERAPRGFLPLISVTYFGMYLAVLTPLVGGLSVKVQDLVGLAAAPPQLGLITGVGALFSIISQPLAGRLSDRTTSTLGMRRPWVLAGAIGSIIALVACGLAPNVTVLLIAWCAAQFVSNFAFAALTATIADQVPEARRGGVSGIIGAATPFSFLIGAILLSLLPTDLLRFTVPAVFALIVGAIFVLRLKDRVRTEAPTESLNVMELLGSFVFNPKKHPDFAWAWLSKFLVLIGYGAVTTYLTLYLGATFGMNTHQQLAFNAIAQAVNIGTLVVFSILGGFLSDRIGRRKPFLVASGIIISVGVASTAVSSLFGQHGLGLILASEALIGLGGGAFFAVDQAFAMSLLPDKNNTAKDLGVLNIANSLPSSLTPLLAGLVVIPVGNSLLHGAGYPVWFLIAGLISLAGTFTVLRVNSVR